MLLSTVGVLGLTGGLKRAVIGTLSPKEWLLLVPPDGLFPYWGQTAAGGVGMSQGPHINVFLWRVPVHCAITSGCRVSCEKQGDYRLIFDQL